MEDLTLDEVINALILVTSLGLLIIPLFLDLRVRDLTRDKKGRITGLKPKGISSNGWLFILVFLLAFGMGIWRVVRDTKSRRIQENRIIDLQGDVDDVKKDIGKKHLQDSVFFTGNFNNILNKIQTGLTKQGLIIGEDLQVRSAKSQSIYPPLISIDHGSYLDIRNNKQFFGGKPLFDPSKHGEIIDTSKYQ